MTLKEKIIDQVQEMPLEVSPTMRDIDNYNLSINNLEKIADEFAIGFAEWKDKLRPSQMVSFWSKNGEFKGKFDMDNEQLLEIYKKEKGL